MGVHANVLSLVVALSASLGCAAEPCEISDDLDAGVDSPACEGRVVLGPIMIGGVILGDGIPCSTSTVTRSELYPMRAHLFDRGRLVQSFDVECGATDYIDLGNLAPGAYEIAVEGRNGSDLNAGTELIRPLPCLDDGIRAEWCRPVPVTVLPCDLRVVPIWLHCGADGCGVPR